MLSKNNIQSRIWTCDLHSNTLTAKLRLPPLPVGEDPGGLPAGHESSEEAEHERGAVEQHVEAVGDQTQAVGPDAVEQLHKRKGLEHIYILHLVI